MMQVYGGIEAGGTKVNCIIGNGPDDIKAEIRISTTNPDDTLDEAFRFFKDYQKRHLLEGIGIAAFGPVDPDPISETYGYITTTVKPGWSFTDIVGMTKKAFGVPVGFDTDVNAAALGEFIWGVGQGIDVLVYLTVGTGIGGGVLIDGKPLHGIRTPDFGHIRIPHDWESDPYPGFCKVHGDCFQGLAAGPAIEERWGVPAENLPPEHDAWELEAEYLSLGVINMLGILAPQRIIFGGGVMKQKFLLPMIREKVIKKIRGYWEIPSIVDRIEDFIVSPGLGDRSGSIGAIELAKRAVDKVVGFSGVEYQK
jgi:fructokinase